MSTWNVSVCEPSICSVSYTHLDVYKRQVLHCQKSGLQYQNPGQNINAFFNLYKIFYCAVFELCGCDPETEIMKNKVTEVLWRT